MYSTKILDKVEYGPGRWNGIRIGVFRTEGESEEQIGEYERNYPNLFRTFYPFKKDEKAFALYSPDYTVTRVMELPSCKDIGGEEHNANGFCPVDLYVPSYVIREYARENGEVQRYLVNEPAETDLKDSDHSKVVTPLQYYPFGFVAGCFWGDDSSWKIQYLDLSEAERGAIKRDERFGYIEMSHGTNLKQSIDMVDYNYDPTEEDGLSVIIAVRRRFDVPTGKVLK